MGLVADQRRSTRIPGFCARPFHRAERELLFDRLESLLEDIPSAGISLARDPSDDPIAGPNDVGSRVRIEERYLADEVIVLLIAYTID